ncbi:MAG: ABC transporter permease [bacterium]
MAIKKNIFNIVKLVIDLSIIDFKEQFKGSFLGVFWAILRPLIFVGTIWFIFSFGLKKSLIDSKYPFILYLLTGYSVWLFFSTALTSGMNSFLSNKHLVKNPNFNIFILPIIKIVSAFYLHVIFIIITLVIMFFTGYYPDIHMIQLPFYIVLLSIFLYGITMLLASLRVFTHDIPQLVSAVLQIGFWVTPIFWSISKIPPKYIWILEINPLVYIINGYRNTFLTHMWLWEDSNFLIPFCIFNFVSLFLGIITYKKLKVHFGDVI